MISLSLINIVFFLFVLLLLVLIFFISKGTFKSESKVMKGGNVKEK